MSNPTIDRLRDEARQVDEEIASLSAIENRTAGQSERLERQITHAHRVADEIAAEERARDAQIEEIRVAAARPENREAGATFNTTREVDPYEGIDRMGSMDASELRERTKRAVGESRILADEHKEGFEQKRAQVQMGTLEGPALPGAMTDPQAIFDAHYLRTSTPEYISGWSKRVTDNHEYLTAEESDALRSVNIGTGAAGQFLTPAVFDPTMLINNAGTANPWRKLARVIPIVGSNVWTGVSSAGMSVGYVGELVANTDNAPVLTQPQIRAWKASSFVPTSIEAFEDIPALQAEVVTWLGDAKDRFESGEFAHGTGSNAIRGIVTALTGTSQAIGHATNSVFTTNDFFTAYESLADRYQVSPDRVWVFARAYLDRVRRFNNTGNVGVETVDLTKETAEFILGARTYLASAVAGASGYTNGLNGVTNNAFIYGSVKDAYTIIERVGLSVEYIPHLVSATNSNGIMPPIGARGWFGHWRAGGDVVTTNAAILSYNPGI